MSQPADEGALLDYPTEDLADEAAAPRHGFQGDRGKVPDVRRAPLGLSIAVSREAGSRGTTIARRIGRDMGWQVYDQELLEYMSQDSAVRAGLNENLTPECITWIDRRLVELDRTCRIGRDEGVVNLARTILALGAQGECILIGRGSTSILPRQTTLNVRIIAPLADRIAYMSQTLRLTTAEATIRVVSTDESRAAFLEKHFGRTPADPHYYDLLLNSSILGEASCAELISHAARLRWDPEGQE